MKILLADLVHDFASGPLRFGAGLGAAGSAEEDETANTASGAVVPYGIASIAAYTKKMLGDSVNLSLFKFPTKLLAQAEKERPDIIAFSNYIWNTHLNYTIGMHLRSLYPASLIVVGGPSVRTDPEGVSQYLIENPFVDICILHDGERPFVEVVRQFAEHGRNFMRDLKPITSTAYLSNGELVYGKNTISEDVDDLPSPYLEGYLDKFLDQGLTPLFETNRGCPFQCTFCAWGVAALNKVRKMPLERVFSEIDYVAEKAPTCTGWIFADANFGMLKRDSEIATKIREIKRKNPALQEVVFFESKNTTDRSIEIANVLKNTDVKVLHQHDHALIALQTLDKVAQEYTKRSNIHLDDIPKKIQAYRKGGAGVRTDVLSGLPGDTHEGHMETLRKCFNLGFDHIGIYNVILLPGTEMETQEHRTKYGIRTKFRARDGAFGEYGGIKAIEAEEIIYGNSAISDDDLFTLRLLHWAIWIGWNHRFLKPILLFAHKKANMNPADVLYRLVTIKGQRYRAVQDLFENLKKEYEDQFFDTAEDLRQHYMNEGTWADITRNSLSRVGFVYNSKFINEPATFAAVLTALQDIIIGDNDSALYEELSALVLKARINPAEIFQADLNPEISLSIPAEISECFLAQPGEILEPRKNIVLRKSIVAQKAIRDTLKRYTYDENALLGIDRTLTTIPDAFFYEILPA